MWVDKYMGVPLRRIQGRGAPPVAPCRPYAIGWMTVGDRGSGPLLSMNAVLLNSKVRTEGGLRWKFDRSFGVEMAIMPYCLFCLCSPLG